MSREKALEVLRAVQHGDDPEALVDHLLVTVSEARCEKLREALERIASPHLDISARRIARAALADSEGKPG